MTLVNTLVAPDVSIDKEWAVPRVVKKTECNYRGVVKADYLTRFMIMLTSDLQQDGG